MSFFGKMNESSSTDTPDTCEVLTGLMSALDASMLVIEFKLDGTVITANSSFCAALKYSPTDVMSKSRNDFLAPGAANASDQKRFWDNLLTGKTASKLEACLAKDNSQVWLQATYCPIVKKDGKVQKIMMLAGDITTQHNNNVDMEGRLSAIDRTQAVIEFELSGVIRGANQNFLKTVGYTLSEIVGKHHRIFAPPGMAETREYAELWETLNRGEFITQRCKRVGKGGKTIWLQATYNPLTGPDGKLIKVVKYATDITKEKEAEEDLQALTRETIEVMDTVSKGDLTRTMSGTYKPELMVLVESINSTIAQLDKAMGKVNAYSHELSKSSSALTALSTSTRAAAHQNTDQTKDVESATNRISEKIDDVVSGLSQLVSSVEQVSSNSFEAASVAEKAVELADSAKLNVNQLAKSSNDIGAVIKVINSIADQTNLLALNATIEAARAGDAGKGFAVVANEVKELAKETARATEEVSINISAIQNDSQVAVAAINDIGSTIESISTTQSSIANTVSEQSALSETISRSVNEVAEGSQQIESTLSKATELATQNQSRADDSQSAATNIGELAQELGSLVEDFKITDR